MHSVVAQRPALAPNVELSGEMQDGAFADRQWLVQRDGQFIQLTELLYRVLEQIDGRRTVDEIAANLLQTAHLKMSPDTVRDLIATKLIPRGLVVKADGSVDLPPGAAGTGGGRSPLAVNMRLKMVSPRLIEPVTGLLQYLYWPPVLIAVLLVVAASQGWLFFAHGVARSAHDALYHPGLMLILLALTVASAAFHEFGHAAALHYGGGKVRGMGVGLYLIYPAFYTDVTDNYRLGRWARVRTDLGGFYFNLIFALGVIAAYFYTRQEFLLLAVVLLDLEIIHQMLPFVRLDGYWALADLTGIPDFFSHIGPFLRTVIPFGRWQGRKLPQLKGWVKVVFAVYILVTIPLLALLLFLMVKSVPRVMATAWDSVSKQRTILSTAYAGRSLVGMTAATLQLVLLLLPACGLLYMLYKLSRKGFGVLWAWGKPTPGRRVLASLLTGAMVALVGYLWAPQLPFHRGPGPLYAQAHFVPIAPDERGTVNEAVDSAVNAVVKPISGETPRSVPGSTKGVRTKAKRATPVRVARTATPKAAQAQSDQARARPADTVGITAAPTPTLAVKITPKGKRRPSRRAVDKPGATTTSATTDATSMPEVVATIGATAMPEVAPTTAPMKAQATPAAPTATPGATVQEMGAPLPGPTDVPTTAPKSQPAATPTRAQAVVATSAPTHTPAIAATRTTVMVRATPTATTGSMSGRATDGTAIPGAVP